MYKESVFYINQVIKLCTVNTIQHWYSKCKFLKLSANSAFSFLRIEP